MSLITEGLRVVRKIFHTEKNPPPIGVVSDVSTEQRALQRSIKEQARIIADSVRNGGEQQFGPMWAQGYTVLSDGRTAFLQQSLGEAQVGEALVINIPPTAYDLYSIHIRYDLGRDEIITYETRQEDGEPINAYMIYDQPGLKTRVPENLTLPDIVAPVENFLRSVAIASNTIMWNKPEPTSLIPV